METVEKQPKLSKKSLKLEKYLISEKQKPGRYILTKLRTGICKLRIETGRYKKPRKEPVEERVCRICRSGEIEDENILS